MKHLIIAAFLLASTTLFAEETPVPALAVKTGAGINSGDFVVGYQFTLEKPMTVTALGVTDQNKDGKLNGSEPVKMAIWDTAGKELVKAEVPLAATAENGTFYVAIEPVRLDAGSYVIGAVTHSGGEGFFYDAPIEAVPGVRWDEGRFAQGAALVLPKGKREPASSYFGPVFKVLASAETAAKPAASVPVTQPQERTVPQNAATAAKPLSSSLRITQPAERAIFQRNKQGVAEVPVAFTISNEQADTVEVRVLDRQKKDLVKDWAKVTPGMKLTLPAGWYQLDFQAKKAEGVVTAVSVERVGVGEVFVACGQSNSANYGKPPQMAQDDRVSSCNFNNGLWQHGDDPQPGADGGGGSSWALLGDVLVKKYDVPVGFICIGVGSTTVADWSPMGPCYKRLKQALQLAGRQGVRAVLWHQGESDSIAGTSAENYAKMLGETIAQARKGAGWDVPWGIALASFHPKPEATADRQTAVVAGQQKVIKTVDGVFQGPETDSFHTRGWLADTVHFNAQGLAAHAQGWADALVPLMQKQNDGKDVRH